MNGFLTKDPLNQPVDWTRRLLTWAGEVQMKFAVYIQSETPCPVSGSFPFEELPAELQLHILQFCNPATLFQLMHVSSTIRHEAQKLFWGNPNAWYRVSGEWLLGGGFTGRTWDDIDFLANVQQIDLVIDNVEQFITDICLDGYRDNVLELINSPSRMRGVDEQIRGIWRLLQDKCPQLTRILVTDLRHREKIAPPHRPLLEILDMCPASISIFGATCFHRGPERGMVLQRCLWQRLNEDAARNWILADPDWTHECILLPPKDFRGPVGTYEYTRYYYCRGSDYDNALRQLEIESIERHHFLGQHHPFTCPEPRCTAYFDQPGQWLRHAAEWNHGMGVNMDLIPEAAAQVAHRLKKEEEGIKHNRKVYESMYAKWGKEGTDQRQAAEDAFLHQLETDPLFASNKPARETAIWQIYERMMNVN